MAKAKKGGQPDNKNAEKWTEPQALKLGNELIAWLTEKDENDKEKDNTFFEEFLYIVKDLYPDVVVYLSKKFPSFSELIKKAKKIQEIKLIKLGRSDRATGTMHIFVLKNHHDYRDKKDVEQRRTVKKFNVGYKEEKEED